MDTPIVLLIALFVFLAGLGFGGMIQSHMDEHISCLTDGATLLHKSTPDDKYLTYYCVKNGKVVP
jgi:hypothetical protein